MADNTDTQGPTEPPSLSDHSENSQIPVQLRFPTIALEASLETLLSHSTDSSQETPSQSTYTMPPPTITPALDESWASIDAYDTQSENEDTGSLIDLSSTHDTESAIGYDTESEISLAGDGESTAPGEEVREDQDAEMHRGRHAEREDEGEGDTIIMEQSQIQINKDSIALEKSRQVPCVRFASGKPALLATEVLNMTASKQPFITSEQPFNVAYYGSASALEDKNEVLGKIGAALVANGSPTTSSTCYNIVPIEFGPGSKPSFSDLIPSQAQMTVEDMTVLKPLRKDALDVRFAFERGPVFESCPEERVSPLLLFHKRNFKYARVEWRPDLLVIQLGEEDTQDDYFAVTEVLELARRHFWPTIIVKSYAADASYPMAYPCGIIKYTLLHTPEGEEVDKKKQPIDLADFVKLDTVQLNYHIKYITEQARKARLRAIVQKQSLSLVETIKYSFQGAFKGPTTYPGSYTLIEVEPTTKWAVKEESSTFSPLHYYQQFVSFASDLSLKDILLTTLIIFFSTWIVSLSTGISQRAGSVSTFSNVSTTGQHEAPAITVTATSALSPSATPIVVPSVDHDVMVYDPVSFDQVWNKLTGRPVQKTEKEKPAVSVVNETSHSTKPSTGLSGMFTAVQEYLDKMLDDMEKSLSEQRQKQSDQSQGTPSFKKKLAHRKQSRQDDQKQIEQMHQKLNDFWSDVSKNVDGLNKQSQDYFNGLVQQSRTHLLKAQFSGRSKLEKLVKEQKAVLARAQSQAQGLVKELPQLKRRSFFGMG